VLLQLDRKQPLLPDSSVQNFLKELLAVCLEDKLCTVPVLACNYIIKFSVWTGTSFLVEGFVEKVLILRICDPLCPFPVRESAISVMTLLHSLDILKAPESYYYDLDIAPNNRMVTSNKYLESFFKILTELIKSASLSLHSDVVIEESNEDTDENMNEVSEESSDSISNDEIFTEEQDPKDFLLECIIHSWCSLVSLVSEDMFDQEFPESYEIFNRFVKYHKNITIKIVACEAIITLSDLNERLPLDKQYDIEIQPLVDRLHRYANESTSHKSRLVWLNLAKALEAEKCVVELPFISVQNKVLANLTKNQLDNRRLNENRGKRESVWTNWSEAITVKYIKNSIGHLFNELMAHNSQFSNRILSLLDNKDRWHLSCQNLPLSMVYVQMTNTVPTILKNKILEKSLDKESFKLFNDWAKKHDKHALNDFVKNGVYLK